MSHRLATAMASATWIVTSIAAVALAAFHLQLLLGSTGKGDWSLVTLSAEMVAYASLGWLLLRRRPGHRVGWLLLATAPMVLAVFVGFTSGATLAEERGTQDLLAGIVAWVAVVLYLPAILLAFPLLGLLFPDGHLPGPRWRLPVALLLAGTGFECIAFGLTPGQFDLALATNPFGIPGLPAEVRMVGNLVTALVIAMGSALGIASMTVRFRRGHGDERAQLKWMLAALVVVVVLQVPSTLGTDSVLLSVASSLSLGLIPAAAAVAILRYRLYGIDRLVSRTLAYAVVIGVLVAMFVVGNLALQAVLTGFTQGGTVAIAASTLLAFALAQPIWRRVRRLVDQRFDRSRLDAEHTVRAFTERQRNQVDLATLMGDLQGTTATAIRPASIGIWITARKGSDG